MHDAFWEGHVTIAVFFPREVRNVASEKWTEEKEENIPLKAEGRQLNAHYFMWSGCTL